MSKSIIFLEKLFLGNFCRHLEIFSGHTDNDVKSEFESEIIVKRFVGKIKHLITLKLGNREQVD